MTTGKTSLLWIIVVLAAVYGFWGLVGSTLEQSKMALEVLPSIDLPSPAEKPPAAEAPADREEAKSAPAAPETMPKEMGLEALGIGKVFNKKAMAPKIADLPAASPVTAGESHRMEQPQPVSAPATTELQAIWNVWPSRADNQRYTVESKLQAATAYRIAVDLSAFAYAATESGVQSVRPGERFVAALQQWLDETERKVVRLKILLLPDTTYFEQQAPQVASLEIDLERMRAARGAALPRIENLFAELRAGRLQNFVFSKTDVDFTVRTRAGLPGGAAPLAISIWDDRRPIDEILVGFCTADSDCAGLRPVQTGFKGFDAVRLAAQDAALRPTAAIHLIQLGSSSPVLGTLWWGNMELPIVWKVEDSAQALASQLRNLMETLVPKPESVNRESEGRALFNLLFPDVEEEGRQARNSFKQLLASHGINELEPYPQNLLPALFVRTHFSADDMPRFLPLGMMAIRIANNQTRFVGEYLRIETPLAVQDYRARGGCLTDWKLVGPSGSEDDALKEAYRAIAGRITGTELAGSTIRIGSRRFPFDQDLGWIEEEKTEAKPLVLSILSHHDRDSIYLDRDKRFRSQLVSRTLGPSSVALLNGCGTGRDGATGFMDALNKRGVQAAIVTVSEIPGSLAGRFMECFASGIEQTAPGAQLPLAEAYTRALRCVSANHGAKALWYALLGNSGIAICGTGEQQ